MPGPVLCTANSISTAESVWLYKLVWLELSPSYPLTLLRCTVRDNLWRAASHAIYMRLNIDIYIKFWHSRLWYPTNTLHTAAGLDTYLFLDAVRSGVMGETFPDIHFCTFEICTIRLLIVPVRNSYVDFASRLWSEIFCCAPKPRRKLNKKASGPSWIIEGGLK